MFEYLYARHRSEYMRIALQYWTTPHHVWKLAHGHDAKTKKDQEILHELHALGIVHRHRRSHRAEDYDMGD